MDQYSLLAQFVDDHHPDALFTRRRLEEDSRRDPVDALHDAEVLLQQLESFGRILAAPDTRYILGERLVADMPSANKAATLRQAQLLVEFNKLRVQRETEGANA